MLIIDAFNVLHTDGVLPAHLANPGVPGLVRLLANSRYAKRDITLVCDGGGSTSRSGVKMNPVRILYSGGGREADDVIEDLIERFHRGNELEIISSDRRLKKAARRKKARCTPSDEFLRNLANDANTRPKNRPNSPRIQVPLDVYSVAAWCEEFGFDPKLVHAANQQKNAPPSPKPRTTPEKKPPAAGLSERLRIELPPEPAAPPPPQTPIAPKEQQKEPDLSTIDPLLIEALEEWRDRLSLDDLCMKKWVPDATPIKQPPHGSGSSP